MTDGSLCDTWERLCVTHERGQKRVCFRKGPSQEVEQELLSEKKPERVQRHVGKVNASIRVQKRGGSQERDPQR